MRMPNVGSLCRCKALEQIRAAVDFALIDVVPHIATRETHERS